VKPVEWLYTRKNIAGASVAVLGPVLAVTGVVPPLLALALIPPLYAIGALVAPSDHNVNVAGWRTQTADSPADRDSETLAALAKVRYDTYGKVSPAVSTLVDGIAATITEALSRTTPETSREVSRTLSRTATEYLPNTLEPYVSLPRMYAEHKKVRDGRTPEQLVCEQLGTIKATVDDILDGILRREADKIAANGEFLNSMFGTQTGNPLNLGPGQ